MVLNTDCDKYERSLWLSPNGDIIYVANCEHAYKAADILEEMGNIDWFDPEKELMSLGWWAKSCFSNSDNTYSIIWKGSVDANQTQRKIIQDWAKQFPDLRIFSENFLGTKG